MWRWPGDLEMEGKEREIKRIKMWYVRGPVPHHECIYYVSQSFTILKIFPCDQGIQC